MTGTSREYYRELRDHYDRKIRQLVPRYDDMVRCTVELVRACAPASVLDLGAGVGGVSATILREIPGTRLVAVEMSEEMFAEATVRLAPFGTRVRLVHENILDFAPDKGFDVVLSNLVLHNLPVAAKSSLLAAIHDWLRPGGAFVWGDLVRHRDHRIQALFVHQRIEHARASGCPEDLVRINFHKEAVEDHPLTVEETLAVAAEAGFGERHVVWAHDTFATVLLAGGGA